MPIRRNIQGDKEWFCDGCGFQCFESEYSTNEGLCNECEKDRREEEEFLRGEEFPDGFR